jgi:hypothetical protein
MNVFSRPRCAVNISVPDKRVKRSGKLNMALKRTQESGQLRDHMKPVARGPIALLHRELWQVEQIFHQLLIGRRARQRADERVVAKVGYALLDISGFNQIRVIY